MLARLSIRAKVLLGFGITLVLSIVIAVVCYRSIGNLMASVSALNETWRLMESGASLSRRLAETVNDAQRYLAAGETERLSQYEKARQDMVEDIDTLDSSNASLPPQEAAKMRDLRPLVAREMTILREAMEGRRNGNEAQVAALLKSPDERALAASIRTILSGFQEAERKVLRRQSDAIYHTARSATLVIACASLLSLLFLVTAGGFILRDIAARRQVEEALKKEHNLLVSLIDAIPSVIFAKDLQGCYIISNVAHSKFLNVASVEETEGKTPADFFPKEVAEQYAADDRSVMDLGEPILNRLEAVIDRNGNFAWRSNSKVPLREPDGKISGLVCVSVDVTERHQAEEKLSHFASQLQNSNDQLQEFASVVSHDLQEPLRKILAFGDRLETKCADSLSEQGREYLERIQDATRRMQTLIRDLLTLSRVTSQGQPFGPVDLDKIVREVVSDLEIRVEQTHARVEIGVLPVIQADPSQMRQLFQNLLGNALKFQRPGEPPEVVVSSRILEARENNPIGTLPGDLICQIVVRDNGIGFDAKYAERIFALFQRLHGRGTYEGTGIGLAVCRKITDRHGGNIVAKSSEGEGAAFIVTLPVKERIGVTV
jgi:PAS domain S-box-containing protein